MSTAVQTKQIVGGVCIYCDAPVFKNTTFTLDQAPATSLADAGIKYRVQSSALIESASHDCPDSPDNQHRVSLISLL
jgi:hypothetical protein